MSRQPSPGPSQTHVAAVAQVFQAVPPPPPSNNTNNRQKSKTFTPGIAAGAEDVKYQAKYKELKRKVKEIEAVSLQKQHILLLTFFHIPPPLSDLVFGC